MFDFLFHCLETNKISQERGNRRTNARKINTKNKAGLNTESSITGDVNIAEVIITNEVSISEEQQSTVDVESASVTHIVITKTRTVCRQAHQSSYVTCDSCRVKHNFYLLKELKLTLTYRNAEESDMLQGRPMKKTKKNVDAALNFLLRTYLQFIVFSLLILDR